MIVLKTRSRESTNFSVSKNNNQSALDQRLATARPLPFFQNLHLNFQSNHEARGAFRLLLLLVFVLGLGAACSSEADNCTAPAVMFSDDFDEDVRCGWAEFDGSDAAEIANGVMTISVGTNGQIAWTNPHKSFTDGEIQVVTRQISGSSNNAYGAICRYVDDQNFYIFLISGDGYYAIGKYQSGFSQVQYLTGTDPNFFVPSDSINQGVAANQLRVRCVGNQLSLYVNGDLLQTVEDSTFIEGDIGLVAGAFEDGRVVIEFDNVRVAP